MIKLLIKLLLLSLLFPTFTNAEQNLSDLKVAFIRDGYVWIKIGTYESRITHEPATHPYPPKWSSDGKMLLYQKEVPNINEAETNMQLELWVYDLTTKKHRKIFYDAHQPSWSPKENIIAFLQRGVLNISDLHTFYNISLGVDDYIWQPNGKGFIASSSATLRPTGWTNPILYMISIEEGYQHLPSITNAKELFVIPTVVKKGDISVMAINAGCFAYSPDQKWISFIVSPTASLAMDSDMLCVISEDGKDFQTLDELILHLDDPKWAFQKNLLGYIAGRGRIVLGFKNKNMKVTELPTYKQINVTPAEFADLAFTWVDDKTLVVARVNESEWSNDPKNRPTPSLYRVPLIGTKQVKLTTPPKNYGDHQPQYLPSIKTLTWFRKLEGSDKGDVWISDPKGENLTIWIKDTLLYSFFQ